MTRCAGIFFVKEAKEHRKREGQEEGKGGGERVKTMAMDMERREQASLQESSWGAGHGYPEKTFLVSSSLS